MAGPGVVELIRAQRDWPAAVDAFRRSESPEERSDPGGLASFAEALELLSAAAFAGLFVVSFAPHLFAEPASLAKFTEATNRFLDRLAGTDP